MDVLTDGAMWAIIVGFLTPPVLSIIQRPTWAQHWRAILTFVWCAVTGAITAYFASAFTGKSIITSILLVLVTAIATYKGLWKPTSISPKIETATSPAAGKRAIE